MAIVSVYDSGATPSLAADVWHSAVLASAPATAPFRVIILITLAEAPSPNWNLWGYCCTESESQSVRLLNPQTPIASAGALPDPVSTGRTIGMRTLVSRTPGVDVSARDASFRGVHWNISRWCGVHRAQVWYLN